MIKFLMLILTFLSAFSVQTLDMQKLKGMKARAIGPATMSGRVTAIAVLNNNTKIMYVGSASGGLWKTESSGLEWKPVFEEEKVGSIGSIAIDQNNPDVIWVGTGEGNPRNSVSSGQGIYRSIDGGHSWQLMGLEKTRNIHRVIIDPTNNDIVYAGAIGSPWGAHKERGVFKTTNGGKTWKKILYTNNLSGVADLVMDPLNPKKLIAAMWQHKRDHWFFKSGGKGSGLYITYDGGETWKKRTDVDGLPKGELGRIGIAIAPSKPNIIYALVEAKKNGLYKSTDGGFKWSLVSEKNIGNRPFYYAELYVDPKNENRIYNVYTYIYRSEDGGKSFANIHPYYNYVHPDHHAFWIHPDNPDFIIDGNDGGMSISRDGASTWRYVENLPVGQFYHVNVDNELPYNVYGGLQDNGSWKGPAYVWRTEGIRSDYWQEIMFGDGFDAIPNPGNSRYVYAMSQGGYVGRVDTKSGYTQFIQPVHPEGLPLRFNWNAAIAQDPNDDNTVYFGSQFVHRSTDNGTNWTIISPDLTTNDTTKQKAHLSGGLTYDATQAENYTTILTIAPSSKNKNVIWAGTDDGNIQLTQDGGKTWKNLASKFKGLPKGSWIAQIHASTYNEGEAFVVANNYRRNDWNPYLYHTVNFGKTWKRLSDPKKIWGYTLSFVQDVIEPNLMFMGTEFNLYVSIDKGKNWTKWKHGYPTASTYDMVIQPRENDLVIGTFGRSIFILDNIQPLREMAQKGTKILKEKLHMFDIPDAYLNHNKRPTGIRFSASSQYVGENRPNGAMITYSVKEAGKKSNAKRSKTKKNEDKTDSLTMNVYDDMSNLIRTIKMVPDTGINRFYWPLREKGVRFPNTAKPKKPPKSEAVGGRVLPGEYKVELSYMGTTVSKMVNVHSDPRIDVDLNILKENRQFTKDFEKTITAVKTAMDRVLDAKEIVKKIRSYMPKDSMYNELKKSMKKIDKQLKDLSNAFYPERDKSIQGIYRPQHTLRSKLNNAYYYGNGSYHKVSNTERDLVKIANREAKQFIDQINTFFNTDWKVFKEEIEKNSFNPFKTYDEDVKIK